MSPNSPTSNPLPGATKHAPKVTTNGNPTANTPGKHNNVVTGVITRATTANAITQGHSPTEFANILANPRRLPTHVWDNRNADTKIAAIMNTGQRKHPPTVEISHAHLTNANTSDPYKTVKTLKAINNRIIQLILDLADQHALPFTPQFKAEFPKLEEDVWKTGSLSQAIFPGDTTVTPLWILGK